MATDVSNAQTSNGSGLQYLHPSISSTLNSEEVLYQSGEGQLKMLSVFTSEKGVDNKVVRYTSADEFIAKTGKPNMKKYGQSAYNIVNWLRSGGEVFGLRVMPDNAGYSHAFLNVLTKTETKTVQNKDGKAVAMPNVVLKPAVAYSEVNNTSESLIQYELERKRTEETIDGFKNHLLFSVYPKGRGTAYNNLGFRISLNTSYDAIYDFRVYNFEIVRFSENSSANIIEGPFYVALSPDALSNSNESMFIEDVVNKFSKQVSLIFNEDAFLDLCKVINPEVSPARLDVLTGNTREVRGVVDTYYSTATQKFEDVHVSLHKYDSSGRGILLSNQPIINIVDAEDIIEQSILLADNVYRKDIYDRNVKNIGYMKEVFNSITNGNYEATIRELLFTPDGTTPESGKIIDMVNKLATYQTTITNLVEIFNASKLDSDFNRIITENVLVESGISQTMALVNELLAYHKAIDMNTDVLNLDELIQQTYNKLNLKAVIDIKAISKKDKINEISNEILELKASGEIEEQLVALVSILTDTKDVLDYLLLIIVENGLSSTEVNRAVDDYNAIIDLYNAIFDPFLSESNISNLVSTLYTNLDHLVSSMYSMAELAITNIDLLIITDIVTNKIATIVSRLVPITYVNERLYSEKLSTTAGKEELLSAIRTNVNNVSAVTTVMKSIVYTNQLQDFNQPTIFMNGSDGDLSDTNASLKIKTETQLISQGYAGLIDSSVTSRKITPFQIILDANYPVDVKNSIVTLVQDIRKDIFFYADTGFLASPEDAITWRGSSFNVSSKYVGIYSQDFVIYDEFNGKDIKVTPTYFLSSKIPTTAAQFGLQYPIAGNRRGTIDGYKGINYIPNESYKELFYTNQLNYTESDPKRTRFGSQLTADTNRTALSDINNVLTALDMKRTVEDLSEDYQFEFNDDETIRTFQYNLNDYLNKYITNRSCEEVTATVFSSDYDKQQHILRVTLSVKFNNVIERIVITIDVVN